MWRSVTELEQKLEKLLQLETMLDEVEDEIGDINIVIEPQFEQAVDRVETFEILDKDDVVESVTAPDVEILRADMKVDLLEVDYTEMETEDLEENNPECVGFDDCEKIAFNNITKQEYQIMTLKDKAKLFIEADFVGVDIAKKVIELLDRIGMDYSASESFDEYGEIDKYFRMNQEKFIIENYVDIAIEKLNEARIDKKMFGEMDIKSK